jgi:hypothetical protein
MSLSPNRADFIGPIRDPPICNLQVMSGQARVQGIGTVSWTVRVIQTEAYYVPSATICLFSPPSYFQDKKRRSLHMTATRASLTLHDGSELEFPYNKGTKLLILPDVPYHLLGSLLKTLQLFLIPRLCRRLCQ